MTPQEVGPDVAREVAERAFDDWASAMDLDVDPSWMDDEDRKEFVVARNRFVTAVMDGKLVVEDDGCLLILTSAGDSVRFPEPKGAALLAMDQRKKNHDMAKMYSCLAECTGKAPHFFAAMKVRDLKLFQTVLTLFLA